MFKNKIHKNENNLPNDEVTDVIIRYIEVWNRVGSDDRLISEPRTKREFNSDEDFLAVGQQIADLPREYSQYPEQQMAGNSQCKFLRNTDQNFSRMMIMIVYLSIYSFIYLRYISP